MLSPTQNFIPVLSSEAGLALTTENWQKVNTSTASYSLERLWYKPGQELLKKITDLNSYLAWPGDIVLNASTLVANKEGVCRLKSPYDGSKIKLTCFDLVALIQHLKPKAVILPQNIRQDYPQIWDGWNDSILPFIHVNDLLKQKELKSYGVYFTELNWEQLVQWLHVPRYVIGNFAPQLIHDLRAKGVGFVETDQPAQAAMQGTVYSRTGNVDLTDEATRMQFDVIDADCTCPTCSQKLTKAYLHHLLQNTPLLCQRFLIQHNVFYVQSDHFV